MKVSNSICFGWRQRPQNALFRVWAIRQITLTLVITLFGLSAQAYCRPNGVVLMIQQTPAQAGTVNPGVGVHRFDLNTEVALTAVPEPGFQFVCWMGDVGDTTAASTITYLNAPKIIIAVFERTQFDVLAPAERVLSTPHGGLNRSAEDYSRQAYSGGGAKRPKGWSWPAEKPEEPEEPDFPSPEDKDDFPVPEPVPEPATVILLGLGGWIALTRRRKKTNG